MSKSLWKDDLVHVGFGFLDNSLPLETKSTLLIALLMLPPNKDEKEWLVLLKKSPDSFLPSELLPFVTHDFSPHPLCDYVFMTMKGTSLSYTEMKEAMTWVLDPTVPLYMKSAFLEALRLKRETITENTACLDLFLKRSEHIVADVPCIIDIANPYDGFNRHANALTDIAKHLAKEGHHVVLHGCAKVAPKYGITVRDVLLSKNIPIPQTFESAIDMLHSKGWTYIDQSIFFPELHELIELRHRMVKRPLLATIEKFLLPIRSKKKNFLITGYTHPAYRETTRSLLSSHPHVSEFLFFRGVEGSSQLPTDKRAPYIYGKKDGDVLEGFIKKTENTAPIAHNVATYRSFLTS